jgi:hypothetical protein
VFQDQQLTNNDFCFAEKLLPFSVCRESFWVVSTIPLVKISESLLVYFKRVLVLVSPKSEISRALLCLLNPHEVFSILMKSFESSSHFQSSSNFQSNFKHTLQDLKHALQVIALKQQTEPKTNTFPPTQTHSNNQPTSPRH